MCVWDGLHNLTMYNLDHKLLLLLLLLSSTLNRSCYENQANYKPIFFSFFFFFINLETTQRFRYRSLDRRVSKSQPRYCNCSSRFLPFLFVFFFVFFFTMRLIHLCPRFKKKRIGAYNCWFMCACVHACVPFLGLL